MADVVLLRDVTPDDLPVFFEHQRDPDANRMAAFPARDRESCMAHWTKILDDPSVTTRTVLVGGEVAGNVVSFDVAGERAVGYWIGRGYWGRGVATRALSAFLREVTTRPLVAHVATHNVASRRVLEKCGFTPWRTETVSDDSGKDVEELILRLEA